MNPGVVCMRLARAIDRGETEFKPSGPRKLVPGRLVRIACYRRYGLVRAAKQLGMNQGTLAGWLHQEGIKPEGKQRPLLPPGPKWHRARLIGKPDTEKLYNGGRR